MIKCWVLGILFAVGVAAGYAEEPVYQKYSVINWRNAPAFQQRIDFNAINYELLDAAIFFATNEVRVVYGMKPLKYTPYLETTARMHASDMVALDFFDHINIFTPSKKTPEERGALVGISNPYIAENIAITFGIRYEAATDLYVVDGEKGLFSSVPGGAVIDNHSYISLADALLKQWINSPGHRTNILSPDALELGCGTAFFRDKVFFNIAKFKAVENFQCYEPVIVK